MPEYKPADIPSCSYDGPEPSKEKMRRPTLSIPIDPDWAAKFNVDGDVTVTITGTIKMLRSVKKSKEDEWDRSEVELEIDKIEMYGENEFSKMVDK